MSEAQQVEAFEAWMMKEYPSVGLTHLPENLKERVNERYDDYEAQLAWDVWLASHEHAKQTMCNRN